MVGLPMRLAVSILVLSLAVPAVVGLVSDVEEEASVHTLDGTVLDIRGALRDVVRMGAGGYGSIHVEMPTGYTLKLGGEGADAASMRFALDGETVRTVHLEDPAVMIVGGPLTLSPGDLLIMGCVVVDGWPCVEVTTG
ncbi:MAG: hypothetical protein IJ026_01590 [Candidatus Methanomethylophilaceae archaeon]|nr:hypothetical protein [Candidatus Methanomethylophilaceae archaeon]